MTGRNETVTERKDRLLEEEDAQASSAAWADLQLCILVFGTSLALYAGASVLPPPLFDPLGSAAIPKVCALILFTLGMPVLISAVRSARRATRDAVMGPALARGAGMMGLSLVYVVSLDTRMVPFWLATAIFVLAGAAMLAGNDRRVLAISGIVAAILGVGGQYIFTEFFYIDLPV